MDIKRYYLKFRRWFRYSNINHKFIFKLIHWRRTLDEIRSRTINIHISDLMIPTQQGMNYGQVVTTSRYLDTKLWFEGKEIKWQSLIANKENGTNSYTNEGYESFINYMLATGINIMLQPVTISDMALSIGDGTHRVGYYLYKCNNFFIYSKIYPLYRFEKCEMDSDKKLGGCTGFAA